MDKELTSLPMETHTRASINMESLMDSDNTNGKTEALTLENLEMDRSMERENGRKWGQLLTVIVMRENTHKIKRTGSGFSLGKVEIFIKEIIRKMKEMVMEKCIGLMGLSTKVNGDKESSMDWVK